MEIITLVIVIIIVILLFTSVNISYKTDNTSNNIQRPRPTKSINFKESNKIDNLGKYNPNASSYALFNLPEKDQYMTPEFRNQIDMLRTKYYYDNCSKNTSILKP